MYFVRLTVHVPLGCICLCCTVHVCFVYLYNIDVHGAMQEACPGVQGSQGQHHHTSV